MSDMFIDVEKVKLEIERLKKVNERLINVFEKLKNDNEQLKLYWDTKLSEITFNEFDSFYKYIESLIEKNKNYIKYLENNVKTSYVTLETAIKNTVEENIS